MGIKINWDEHNLLKQDTGTTTEPTPTAPIIESDTPNIVADTAEEITEQVDTDGNRETEE